MAEVRLIDANAIFPNDSITVWSFDGEETARGILKAIDNAPTIDAVPVVHARWVDNHCTACGMMPMGDEMWEHLDETPPRMEFFMSYCPCCGAKMDGGAEG